MSFADMGSTVTRSLRHRLLVEDLPHPIRPDGDLDIHFPGPLADYPAGTAALTKYTGLCLREIAHEAPRVSAGIAHR